MTTFLVIYCVGVIINALAAASIWDDLMEDKQLVKVRLAVVLFFVLSSIATWIYAICYLIAKGIKSLFKRKSKNKSDNENGTTL